MAEARYRIERPVDYAEIFANRRSHGVLLDQPASRLRLFEDPVQRLPLDHGGSLVGTGGIVRGNFSSWRPGNRTGSAHSPFRLSQGRENMPVASARRARGRASASLLPSWYPRTPLRDITHIMRVIERRRRAGMGVDDGQETETSTQQVDVLQTPVPLAGEQNCVMVTPAPAVGFKRSCPPSTATVRKMLLDITKEISEDEEAGFITPEKKLLNSIDLVQKIVLEEIQKLKTTPLAKREEREKRVKTLMSMR